MRRLWLCLLLSGGCSGSSIERLLNDQERNSVSPARIIITESPPCVNIAEGGAACVYALVLTVRPTADVIITATPDAQVTVNGSATPVGITFSPVNWDAPQTITVAAVDDTLSEGTHSGIITHAVASADTNYNGFALANVTATIADNDSAGIVVSSAGSLTTSEAGTQAFFSLSLSSQPAADVTIGLSSSNAAEGTVSPTSVTFTAANWNSPQNITIDGIDDPGVDGPQNYQIITAPAVSGDGGYNNLDAADISVTNLDNDSPGITVTPVSGLVTTEQGGGAVFTVVLNSQPGASVTIPISSNDATEGTVTPASLVFTAADWDSPQTVTVTGVEDVIADGDIGYAIITGTAVSGDSGFNGVNPPDVAVLNLDNDTPGIIIAPSSGLITTETGGTDTFTVVLNNPPTANVTIGLSTNDASEGTMTPASLTFTPANWNIEQTVLVTGVDDTGTDGNKTYKIVTAAASSADANYNLLNPVDVNVTNTDDETPGVTVAPTSGIQVDENGAQDTFDVVLNKAPTANVTINLSSDHVAEGSVSPASLVFTPGDWNIKQTVTVTGLDDAAVDGNKNFKITTSNTISLQSAYNNLTVADVNCTNFDNDTPGFKLTPLNGLITTEIGGQDSFSVRLNSAPTTNVTIAVYSGDLTEGTVNVSSLTFTPLDWSTPQFVVVTGADDTVNDGDANYSVKFGAAVSGDSAYNGKKPPEVKLKNIDND